MKESPLPPERAVLTLALDKPLYVQMAVNLARSFCWWHRDSSIRFFLATDRPDLMPSDLRNVSIMALTPGEFGHGFSPKLHLDSIAPGARTLFIDADCLCVGNLDSVFARFRGRPVGVVGGKISEGDWFGDIAPLCRQLGVASLPKFNGGIYYLERGDVATGVYTRARELEKNYDALGLTRLRGRPNDELVMAMAMAAHSIDAFPDDGTILSSPYECPGPFRIDVIKGRSDLVNPPAPSPSHRSWYPFTRVHPILVHFLAGFDRSHQYRSEAMRLRYWAHGYVPRTVARGYAFLAITLPGVATEWLKARLRSLYRSVFGIRQLRRSERL